MLAREESHSVSGLLLARRDKGVTAEPAGLKEAAFGPSRPPASVRRTLLCHFLSTTVSTHPVTQLMSEALRSGIAVVKAG